MPTRNQHYVPRVYIKSWETTVSSLHEPNKQFQGVYEFRNHDLCSGNGITKEKVLCGNHTYTISQDYFFIVPTCPHVAIDYGKKINDILVQRSVAAFFQGQALLSPIDYGNALPTLEHWNFKEIRSSRDLSTRNDRAIKNQISSLKSYIIEEKFSSSMENDWQTIYANFISEIQSAVPYGSDQLKRISTNSANEILRCLLLMAFRNPDFDFFGIYPSVEKALIIPLFDALSNGNPNSEWNQSPLILKRGYWITEVYKALFGISKSAFDAAITATRKHLKLVLFEIGQNCDGEFITSDNPSFFHISAIEAINRNGIYFPISPRHLLMLARSDQNKMNEIAYRTVGIQDIKTINRIILNESNHSIISRQKHLGYLL